MIPIYDGVGCIRGFSSAFYMYEIMRDVPSKLHIFGLQCFKRPGLQFAYGFETEQRDNYDR